MEKILTHTDLHMHSAYSDGSDTPAEIIEKLRRREITTFALTDHDTIAGCDEMARVVPEDMTFFRGIEFSCKSDAGKCHILGYAYDPKSPDIREAVAEGERLRDRKFYERLEHLRVQHGIVFDSDEMHWLLSRTSVGKPHIASLLIKRGLVTDIKEAIDLYIDDHGQKMKTGNTRIPASMAVKAILAAGGIPVWAHPLGGEGERRISAEEFQAQLETLLSYGLQGLECWYSRYTEKEIQGLLGTAQEKGLLVSGGSDYHGKNKPTIYPGLLNCENVTVPEESLTILLRLRATL
ncbi:MAG: PHP domain-containing protein [Clostridium sp.]|nr:PHP domain-containing protein [Clostridium sp.]